LAEQRVCVSSDSYDVEAWTVFEGGNQASYRRTVDAVAAEVDRLGRAGRIWVELWPDVLEQYRRDGLIGG
jgi:hypothetical protein